MDFMTTKEASKKWELTERMVHIIVKQAAFLG